MGQGLSILNAEVVVVLSSLCFVGTVCGFTMRATQVRTRMRASEGYFVCVYISMRSDAAALSTDFYSVTLVTAYTKFWRTFQLLLSTAVNSKYRGTNYSKLVRLETSEREVNLYL